MTNNDFLVLCQCDLSAQALRADTLKYSALNLKMTVGSFRMLMRGLETEDAKERLRKVIEIANNEILVLTDARLKCGVLQCDTREKISLLEANS